MCERIEEKKKLLSLRKKEYSELTDTLSSLQQLHFRMFKALKKQNLNIKNDIKKYVNCCVQRALNEAEYEYSMTILREVNDQTLYVRDLSPFFFFSLHFSLSFTLSLFFSLSFTLCFSRMTSHYFSFFRIKKLKLQQNLVKFY